MFIGHFGLALAAAPLAPRRSLGTLFLAAQLIDLAWPTFLLLGLERVRIDPSLPGLTPLAFEHYPYTHSLLAACLWALGFGAAVWAATRDARGAQVAGLLVVSHWLLDLLVHRPDLPLVPGGELRIGLGLWETQPALVIALETALFIAGAWLFLRARGASLSQAARWGAFALLAFLAAIHAVNVFGPPPPSVEAIAWAGHAQWLFVLWAYAVDRPARAALRPPLRAA